LARTETHQASPYVYFSPSFLVSALGPNIRINARFSTTFSPCSSHSGKDHVDQKYKIIQWYILLPSKTQQYINGRRISTLIMATCFGCYETLIRPYKTKNRIFSIHFTYRRHIFLIFMIF